jgi:GNAT superfamily N-acetyltransferase
MQGITSEQYPNFVEFTDDETVRQAIETGNVPHLLIVEGQPVGTIWHKIDREDPTIGHVRKLAVLPAYRGRGYGEMLFAYAESKLRESGAHISRLKCNDNLPRLHAYYERLGYHKTATEQFASLPFAVLTMEKLL